MALPTDPTEAALSGGVVVAAGVLGALWFVAIGRAVDAAWLGLYVLAGVGLFASHRED